MDIRVAISTIPTRLEMADALHRQLTGQVPGDVYVDNPPSGSSWNNYRAALSNQSFPPPMPDWLICLDDDVILCDNFLAEAKAALSMCPGSIANLLYTHRSVDVMKALHAAACWIEKEHFVQGAGFAIRPTLGLEAVAWIDEHIRPDFKSGDQRLSAFVAATGRHTYASVPSLVEHRNDVESVMYPASRDGSRRAGWFQRDAGGVVWNSRSVPSFEDSAKRFLMLLTKRGTCFIEGKAP